ncbi:MAG: peptidase [Fibrobacter sp.]|nr:peptidase [Fibrobacter sp.]
MAYLDRKVRRLQWRTSKSRLFFAVFIMLLAFTGALAIRYYAIEPILLRDTAMQPLIKKGSLVWVCRLPQCIDKASFGDIVWARQTNDETLVRKIIGYPGDTIEISDKGRIKTKRKRFMWRGEDSFIETRKFYVPRQGDTIILSALNDVEEDYILRLMNEQGLPLTIKSTLWQGNREIPIERIGSTKLGHRLVSLKELDVLPWQDRRLIEMQIRQAEPGNSPIKIKRQFFVEGDSVPLDTFVVASDNYYLACEKGNHCVDSRELGFFTKERILGRYIKQPDIAKQFVLKKLQEFQKTFLPIKKKEDHNEAPKEPAKEEPKKIKVEVEAIKKDARHDDPHQVNENKPGRNVKVREIKRPHAIKAIDPVTEPTKGQKK